VERAWRWCRRKPALAASDFALAAVSAAVIISVCFVIYLARISREEQLRFAELALEKGLDRCMRGQVIEGMVWLAHSLEIAPAHAPDLDRVIRTNLAGWRRWLNPVLPHEDKVVAVA